MCGLTGFWARSGGAYHNALDAMTESLVHRGPDDAGTWRDDENGIGMGFRRLSILDLSPAGHQPMHSACGRYVIAFNGEIYNHLELRAELEGEGAAPAWRGHSDTETLLAAFVRWGIREALKRTIGMFALALWDRQERKLTLARDRLGEKPLYYGWQGDVFLFGSELKALRAHPACRHAGVDRAALCLLLRYNYIPAPSSIYQGIRKLPPGTWLSLSAGQREPRVEAYWSLRQAVEDGMKDPFTGDEHEAVTALESLLKDAVARQMVADVPLGAFLSGGVDSSTAVSLMQAQSARPVNTFSIGFHESQHNEAQYAKAVAGHLGTAHTELYVTATQAMEVIPRLPALYDEPYADSSQIPTFLVAQLARRHVKVSISGDGGDELFGGYNRYFWSRRIWNKVSWMPRFARSLLARSLIAIPPEHLNAAYARVEHFLPGSVRVSLMGDKLHRLAERLKTVEDLDDLYYSLVSEWTRPSEVVRGGEEPATLVTRRSDWPALPESEHRMMYLDAMTYLPDDILVKVDRAAMGVSLETRTPYLDHRVVELAWRLPLNMKIRAGQGKWALREILYKYVPRHLIERPKQGFGIPLDAWLRGPLREWAETLLNPEKLKREGFFNPGPIRKKWEEHLSLRRNWQFHLWPVLVFQSWLESSR
jgi:asparagine synthase (glutamine-hydrolysing)